MRLLPHCAVSSLLLLLSTTVVPYLSQSTLVHMSLRFPKKTSFGLVFVFGAKTAVKHD